MPPPAPVEGLGIPGNGLKTLSTEMITQQEQTAGASHSIPAPRSCEGLECVAEEPEWPGEPSPRAFPNPFGFGILLDGFKHMGDAQSLFSGELLWCRISLHS